MVQSIKIKSKSLKHYNLIKVHLLKITHLFLQNSRCTISKIMWMFFNIKDFEDAFPKEDQNRTVEEMVVENVEDVDNTTKAKSDENEKDREKDSGTDSPGLKDATQREVDNDANIDSDPDLRDVEDDEVFDEEYVKGTTKLPPGFIRDPQGRIIVSILFVVTF